MLRLFAALPVPDEIATEIERVQRGIEGARWSPAENLHITLRFMGEVDERTAEDIDVELGKIRQAPFDVALKGTGFFGREQPHAAWLAVEQNLQVEKLNRLCEKACRTIGLPADPREYTPHVTVCYFGRGQALDEVIGYQARHALFTAGPWLADRFYLYSSQTKGRGPSRFRIEAEYPLIG